MKRNFHFYNRFCTTWLLMAFILLIGSLAHGTDHSPLKAETDPAESFQEWLAVFGHEAVLKGIDPRTIEIALKDLEPIPRVIELDRSQPEFTLSFDKYMEHAISGFRVKKARRMLRKHRLLLEQIRSRYNVQPRFLVALWAIETNFGRNRGGFPVIGSLATLAHEGRRREYFTRELLDALRIVDAGYATPAEMKGSWAGAIGQLQFMPSKVLKYWVDHDGNGHADIWESPDEALVSAGNYLSKVNWKGGQKWGRKVKLPGNFDTGLAGLETRKHLSRWQQLGLRRADGGHLPGADMEASLVIVEGGPAFLVYDNYRALLEWNKSTFFAVSVGTLADRIGN